MHGLLRTLSQSVIQRTWGDGVRDKDGDCVSLVMEANLWPESNISHQLLCDLSPLIPLGFSLIRIQGGKVALSIQNIL